MKNKIISICIGLIFIFTLIISVDAIGRIPMIELEDYQITSSNIKDVYIQGYINISVGQVIGVFDSTGNRIYAWQQLKNTNKKERFKLKIPSIYLKEGENSFKVKSLPIKNVINGSNPKTLTIIIDGNKKNQTITANNITVKVGEKKNINAKVSSNLSLSYLVQNPNIATVDSKGNVIGRKEGTTTAIIIQCGNKEYKQTNKSINITVKSDSITRQNQTISAKKLKLKVGETKNINAKINSGLSLKYNIKNDSIATVDSKGNVTGKKKGSTKLTISQAGDKKFKPVSKTVNIIVGDNDINDDDNDTYKIIYNPSGGKGNTAPQEVIVGKTTQLKANNFKRTGYKFVGWTTEKYTAKIKGKNVDNWKNVNMKHFQLGKVKYKNGAKVKNLAKKNKTIVLYAVWRGDGIQAALDWGALVGYAGFGYKDDVFPKSKRTGCYFCGTGKKSHGSKKSYVCVTYANACFYHGGNIPCFKGKKSLHMNGNSDISRMKKKNKHCMKYLGHIKKKDLKKGDILVKNGKHTCIYYGKVNGKHCVIECTDSSRQNHGPQKGHTGIHYLNFYDKCKVFRLKDKYQD